MQLYVSKRAQMKYFCFKMLCHFYLLFNVSYQYPLHFCLFYLFKEVQVVHKKLELSNERIMQIQEGPYIENT